MLLNSCSVPYIKYQIISGNVELLCTPQIKKNNVFYLSQATFDGTLRVKNVR